MSYTLTLNKFLTKPEREAALVSIGLLSENPEKRADALALELMMNTGARPSEILGLEGRAKGISRSSLGAEVDPETKEIIFFIEIEGLKGSNSRRVPISEALHRKTFLLAKGLLNDEPIFKICLRTLQRTWMSVRPAAKSLKSLRHTFALHAYEKTLDVQLVRRVLGHRNIINTMIYLEFYHSLSQLRKIL